MANTWIQVALYVVLNVPVSTHQELWKPGNPHPTRLGAPIKLPIRDLTTTGDDSYGVGWIRQHLIPFFNLGETHRHVLDWKEPNSPADRAGRAPRSPEGVQPDSSMSATNEKQHLVPAPKHDAKHERNRHPYRLVFKGRVTLDNHPLEKTAVVLRLTTSRANEIRKVDSDARGRYAISVPFDGKDDENANWSIHAEGDHGRSLDFEGSHILSHQEPSISVTKELPISQQ